MRHQLVIHDLKTGSAGCECGWTYERRLQSRVDPMDPKQTRDDIVNSFRRHKDVADAMESDRSAAAMRF